MMEKENIENFERVIREFETEMNQVLNMPKNLEIFQSPNLVVGPFKRVCNNWRKSPNKGRKEINAVIERANEINVVRGILEASNGNIKKIEYEPKLPIIDKTIDLLIKTETGKDIYLDIKTIQPECINSWKKFISLKNKDRFTKNNDIILNENFMGGEIFHQMFNSRTHFLDYSFEFDKKIDSIPNKSEYFYMMCFCGNGSDWDETYLEDFVTLYKSFPNYRDDDDFAEMQIYYIQNDPKFKNWNRNIDGFCYLFTDSLEPHLFMEEFCQIGKVSDRCVRNCTIDFSNYHIPLL